MDHTDQTAQAASRVTTEARRCGMDSILQAAASRAALGALEQTLTLASAAGDKRGIAQQATALAQSSLRTLAQMREHLAVTEGLPR